jgi:hypothetical protein
MPCPSCLEMKYVQLPYVAATCKQPLPTPSAALFSVSATYSVGSFPALDAADVRSEIVSSRREVLLRRQASKISSLGDAPWVLCQIGLKRSKKSIVYLLVRHVVDLS